MAIAITQRLRPKQRRDSSNPPDRRWTASEQRVNLNQVARPSHEGNQEEEMRRDKKRSFITAIVGFIALGIPSSSAVAEDANQAQLDALRQSLAKYEDYQAAVRDLYLSTVGCVHYSGE